MSAHRGRNRARPATRRVRAVLASVVTATLLAAVGCTFAAATPKAVTLESLPPSERLAAFGETLFTIHTGGEIHADGAKDNWLVLTRDRDGYDFVMLATEGSTVYPVCKGLPPGRLHETCLGEAAHMGGWGSLFVGFGYVPSEIARVHVEGNAKSRVTIDVVPENGVYLYYLWHQHTTFDTAYPPLPTVDKVEFLDGSGRVVQTLVPFSSR